MQCQIYGFDSDETVAGGLGLDLEATLEATVSYIYDTAPEGTKGLGQVVAILVETTPPVLVSLVVALQAWMLRHRDQTLKVKVGDREVEVPAGSDPNAALRIAERLMAMGEEHENVE